ncbi:MAG: hypothetical protein Q4F35_05115 [Akkermansia sp.]|nr:hypothetical protein [Akkermansia sp.]
MAEKSFDMEIGLGMAYDPSGAAAANADIDKLKQNAASVPQSGGSSAAPAPQDGGKVDTSEEESLAKARENTAEATGKATEASKELSAARTDGQKATTAAATVEKTLATERKATADATTSAADAEQKAAAEATAAAQQKQQASAQNTEALSKEQQEIEALKAQMALEAKGRAGLIKELERLGKARARAAKAGDVQAFKALEAQMTKTRAAFERMNQGLEISRLGMMGQMQVAMGAMGAIQSLGNEVKSGSVSLMGMANAVYALGAAIKAGMGPVGWIMMAIQGLSMAWDWYANKQEEAAKAERERMEAEHEALMKHWEEVEKFARMDRDNTLTRWQRDFDAMRQEWEQFTQQEQAARRAADVQASAAEERRRIAAQSAYDAEVARIELVKTMGEISEAEAISRKAAAEEAKAAELQAIDEAEAHRNNVAHINAKRRAKREAEEMANALEEKFGDFEDILRVDMPTNEEWEALQIKLNEGLGSIEERVQSRYIHDKIRELKQMLEAMGIAWQGSDAELIKWVNSMREAREAGEQRVRELQAIAQEEGTAAQEVKLTNENRRAEAKAEAERREATRKLDEARLQKQQEANRLAEEWQAMQRGTLAEQAAWLEQTAASFEEGSAEAKKWEEALRGVKLRQVNEELNNLGETFKVTGNYAAKDNRTQAQIHAADEKALRQRREALERLKAAPDVDAATLKAINSKIKETDRQMRGLRQSMRDAAHAAQQSVAALKPLGQKARTRGMQTALQRSEKAFVRLAQQAERQASRGDTRGMERTLAAMRRNAAQQERLTGYTGRAAGHMRNVEGKLRLVAKGTAAQDRGLTAQQRQQNRVLQSLGMQRRFNARQERAGNRAAKAKEQEAKANERNARQATRDARQAKPKTQARQIQELTTKLQEANKSLAEQKTEVLRLDEAIQALTAAAREGAVASRNCATAAAGQMATLKRDIKALQRAVERLRRK